MSACNLGNTQFTHFPLSSLKHLKDYLTFLYQHFLHFKVILFCWLEVNDNQIFKLKHLQKWKNDFYNFYDILDQLYCWRQMRRRENPCKQTEDPVAHTVDKSFSIFSIILRCEWVIQITVHLYWNCFLLIKSVSFVCRVMMA